MKALWTCDGLIAHGYFVNPVPSAQVGGEIKVDGNEPTEHTRMTIRQEDDGSFTVICDAMTKHHGREVILSSPDNPDHKKAVQSRWGDQRFADETFTGIQPKSGVSFSPDKALWSEHTRTFGDGVRRAFAPTLFTIVNLQPKAA